MIISIILIILLYINAKTFKYKKHRAIGARCLIGEMSYYNVHITKIEEYERKYRIFYVADDRRAIDRQMETYIIKSIKKSYKGMFSIRRMKNIDGANATWQEWLNRPNKSSD